MTSEAPQALERCPEPEQLAAFIDGGLSPEERAAVEGHLTACADCRDVVGDTVTAVRQDPAIGGVWLAIVGGLLVATAVLVLVVRLQQPSPYYVPEMAKLVRLEMPTRATEGRLTGGFRYAPPPPLAHAADAAGRELAATAAQVRSQIGARRGAAADAARGVTFLLSGQADQAVAALEHATAGPSPSPAMLSDLAAAYLQRGDADDAARAFAVSERALRHEPALREAAFNQALALERMQRTADAARAWREYADREREAAWANEARSHVARLTLPRPR